eukprot:150776-Rhodomonas_salina.1
MRLSAVMRATTSWYQNISRQNHTSRYQNILGPYHRSWFQNIRPSTPISHYWGAFAVLGSVRCLGCAVRSRAWYLGVD